MATRFTFTYSHSTGTVDTLDFGQAIIDATTNPLLVGKDRNSSADAIAYIEGATPNGLGHTIDHYPNGRDIIIRNFIPEDAPVIPPVGPATTAAMISNDTSNQTGLLSTARNQQAVNDLVDATGLGSAPVTFTGSFFCSFGEFGNQDTWYGGRQTGFLDGARGQASGQYTFELPDISEFTAMFDDMEARGIPEIWQRTIGYLGGSTSSVVRNSLTIRTANVSPLFDRNEFPVTIAQGASVTVRVMRVGGVITPIERVGVQQSADPGGDIW